MVKDDPPRIATQKDVADALGLAQATVSRALAQRNGVSEELRQRIEATAKKLGYRPNIGARLLSHVRHTKHEHPIQAELAWLNVWPQPEKLRKYPEFDLYWQGAAEQAERLGFRLEEFDLSEMGSLKRIEHALIARGIEGILLPPSGAIQLDWGEFNWDQFCAVRMSRTITSLPFHLVTADQFANTMLTVQKMRLRGYERIGFVNMIESEPAPHARHFVYGYLAAMHDVPRGEQVPIFEPPAKSPQRAFERWIHREKPDAILVDGDASELIRNAGYLIPADFGMASTSVQNDSITSGIYQNPKEIGRISLNLVATLIRDNERGTPPTFRQVLIEGRWVEGTTLPPRRH